MSLREAGDEGEDLEGDCHLGGLVEWDGEDLQVKGFGNVSGGGGDLPMVGNWGENLEG